MLLLSRVCEEFHCTPRQALAEWPALCEAIIGVRAYVRAHDEVERAAEPHLLPKVGMVGLVMEHRDRLRKERLARQGRRRG